MAWLNSRILKPIFHYDFIEPEQRLSAKEVLIRKKEHKFTEED